MYPVHVPSGTGYRGTQHRRCVPHVPPGAPGARMYPPMTSTPIHRVVWTADRSGLGHASRPGRVLALCGARSRDPRWGWPLTTWCPVCLVLVDSPGVVIRRCSPLIGDTP